MRQQFGDVPVRMRRQTRENVTQVGVRIVTIVLGGGDQAHDRSGTYAGGFGSGE